MNADNGPEARRLLARLRGAGTRAGNAIRFSDLELAGLREIMPELQAGAVALARSFEERRESSGIDGALPGLLAQELDAISRVIEKPSDKRDGGVEPGDTTAIDAARHLLRAELVLELMADAEPEDAKSGRSPAVVDADMAPGRQPPAQAEATTASAAGGPAQPRQLRSDEVQTLLRRHRWGVLSTDEDGRPYAVPVIYGFDGERFFFVSGPGRKAANLEKNPAVCLTVVEVIDDGASWASVVATGTAQTVDDLVGRLTAFRVLRRQRPGASPRRVADAARLLRAKVFRVTPDALTGRALDWPAADGPRN